MLIFTTWFLPFLIQAIAVEKNLNLAKHTWAVIYTLSFFEMADWDDCTYSEWIEIAFLIRIL